MPSLHIEKARRVPRAAWRRARVECEKA